VVLVLDSGEDHKQEKELHQELVNVRLAARDK
jgi:hypothetical protein